MVLSLLGLPYLNRTLGGTHLLPRTTYVPFGTWSNDVMEALFLTKDVSVIMSGLASSVTKHIREGDRDLSKGVRYVTGNSFRTEPFLRVRWIWLVLPFVVLLLAMIFFVASIVRTSRDRLPVWKTSSLVAVFQGLDVHENRQPDEHDRLPLSGVRAMDEAAEAVDMQLCRIEPQGWCLAKVDQVFDSMVLTSTHSTIGLMSLQYTAKQLITSYSRLTSLNLWQYNFQYFQKFINIDPELRVSFSTYTLEI